MTPCSCFDHLYDVVKNYLDGVLTYEQQFDLIQDIILLHDLHIGACSYCHTTNGHLSKCPYKGDP